MIPQLENFLYKRIRKQGDINAPDPRTIINYMLEHNMIKNPKQAWATLLKWNNQGYYTWGCCLDLGWKTDKERKPRQ